MYDQATLALLAIFNEAVGEDEPKPKSDVWLEKKECEHEWRFADNKEYNYIRCKKCDGVRPKPKKIDFLNPFGRHKPPTKFEQVHYAIGKMADKIDEIINHLTRGKG